VIPTHVVDRTRALVLERSLTLDSGHGRGVENTICKLMVYGSDATPGRVVDG